MMIRELDTVVLTRDIPELRLIAGDAGAVVQVLAPDLFEVEFVALDGRTIGLSRLGAADIRPAAPVEVPKARARA